MKAYILPAKIKEIEFALSANWSDLAELGEESNGYIHVKRGSKVLGVVHADTYGRWTGEWSLNNAVLTAPTIDDRIGLWILLYLLPAMDMNVDVLITNGEESGQSTAGAFKDRSYNWALSFDRGGRDTVLYQHDNKKWRSLLAGYGFEVGSGSFSDLSVLDIGVFGMNIGCGMKNYHSQTASANLWELYYNIVALNKFCRDFYDIRLPSTKPKPRHSFSEGSRWVSNGRWGRDYSYAPSGKMVCPVCGANKSWVDIAYDSQIKSNICVDCAELLLEHPGVKSRWQLQQLLEGES